MGETNWTELDDGLDSATVDRGTTTGIARPAGGGSFIFGFNSRSTAAGAAGLFTNQTDYAPTAALKGGSVRGAVQRGVSSGDTGHSPLLFICGQGTSVNDLAYLLGLQDDEPHKIVLRKGTIVAGIPAGSPGTTGILRRSTGTFVKGTWLHLRLDAVVNVNGDVILKAFRSDLDAHDVTSPVWAAIPGLEDPDLADSHGAGTCFVDDTLAVNSGSSPYTTGYMGFGFQTGNVSRRGYFDQIECIRQL